MVITSVKDKIKELLEAKFADNNCYLVEIKTNPHNNQIRVFMDCDTGLTIRTCEETSRYLEHYLDQDEQLAGKYILEVSSPGLDEPLKLKRQYNKNIGRGIRLILTNGGTKEGKLLHSNEDNIRIEEEVKGEKKKRELVETTVPYNDIKSAKITVNFK